MKYIFRKIGVWFGRYFPEQWIRFRYYIRFGKMLNLKNPKTLNEKILYLSLNTDTSKWTNLADKYHVRDYVTRCGCADTLVQLYGMWENANDIDFDTLPQSFVLKANHGSGDVCIIKDKNSIDKHAVVAYFNKIIRTPYGEIEVGKHYARIKPCIIAEELLENDKQSSRYSRSIIDYKCWCFNGHCHYIWVCCNRDKHGTEVLTYDRDWKDHPEFSVFTAHYPRGKVIPKPENFEKMIHVAELLSRPFPCVRVDLYNIGGKIYFGEMTFTSLGGLMNYFNDDFLKKMGDMIDLNYVVEN